MPTRTNATRKETITATNVTERDKALRKVMDLIDKQLAHAAHSEHFEANAQSQHTALLTLKDQIKAMLGYSGHMPSEVPNQSKDAK